MTSRKQPKTLSGIETNFTIGGDRPPKCRKQPKTLSGIETRILSYLATFTVSRKQPKTLSGIETAQWQEMERAIGPKTT